MLLFLVQRANWTTFRVRARLHHVAESIGWTKKSDTLYRVFQRLSKKGLLSYETVVGRNLPVYVIQLLPPDFEPLKRSEADPREPRPLPRVSKGHQNGSTVWNQTDVATDLAETDSIPFGEPHPSRAPVHPTVSDHASAAAEPDRDGADVAAIRGAQTVQNKQTLTKDTMYFRLQEEVTDVPPSGCEQCRREMPLRLYGRMWLCSECEANRRRVAARGTDG